jgi:glycosyltransferase involved in cell wall biosynthesis
MFSVLISLYRNDNPRHLEIALNSIENQTLRPNQVVVIIDGYISDELSLVINKFKNKKEYDIYQLQKNVGLGPALNFGLTKVTNEYVFRMDSDDFSHPERFKLHFNFVLKKKLDISSTYVNEFNDSTSVRRLKKIVITQKEIKNLLPQGCPFNHPATCYKKNVILDAGGYENIYLKEDMGLWIKLAANNSLKMENYPIPLLDMRINSDSFGRRRGLKIVLSEIKLFNLHYKLHKRIFKYIYLILIIPFRFMPSIILEYLYTFQRKYFK